MTERTTAGAAAAADRERYRRTHDLEDFDRFECVYGCADPVSCSFPHERCRHCARARALARPRIDAR